MIIQSFSSKHRHVTEKHDLIGPPLIYFTYWLRSRHLNHLISEILEQTNTWFEVSATFVYRKHINKVENFPTLARKFASQR